MKEELIDETFSTCPTCGGLIPVRIVYGKAGVEYAGACPHHGDFIRRNGHFAPCAVQGSAERGRK